MLRKMAIAMVVGTTLGLTGCGYSCVDLCEDAAECDGNDTNPEDCGPICEIEERIVEDFGCDEQYDELLSCAGEIEDICDEDEDACEDESEDFLECMIEYWEDHPSNDDC